MCAGLSAYIFANDIGAYTYYTRGACLDDIVPILFFSAIRDPVSLRCFRSLFIPLLLLLLLFFFFFSLFWRIAGARVPRIRFELENKHVHGRGRREELERERARLLLVFAMTFSRSLSSCF